MTRRTFFASAAGSTLAARAAISRPVVCVFSKHLAKLTYAELGRAAHDMGFDGVDLTVRPGGHVEPARVAEDLPRALDAIRAAGVRVPMITTAITSAADPSARTILGTAGKLGIPFYKLGYWPFGAGEPGTVLQRTRAALEPLVALGRDCGITAGFHNHSGDCVGYDVHDIRDLIRGLDANWIGFYFDTCHATIEGGLFGWDVAQRIALKQIKLAAMKDFYWERRGEHWQVRWCPMGQGMVNWPKVLSTYAAARYAGPMSVHIEYDPRDAIPATTRDLQFLRKQIAAAYGE